MIATAQTEPAAKLASSSSHAKRHYRDKLFVEPRGPDREGGCWPDRHKEGGCWSGRHNEGGWPNAWGTLCDFATHAPQTMRRMKLKPKPTLEDHRSTNSLPQENKRYFLLFIITAYTHALLQIRNL
jgi:hypothetical protein